MRQRLLVAAALAALSLSGCVSLPSPALVAGAADAQPALGPEPITVLSWNVRKGQAASWSDGLRDGALRRRLLAADLLLLQEACARPGTGPPDLAPLLTSGGFGWRFAAGFKSAMLGCGGDVATGVLTAARATPLQSIALRSQGREFGLTPKTALLTTYALRGRDQVLLVVNVHLLNFEFLGPDAFAAQLGRIADRVAKHDGPVLMAGDFNTRNRQRLALLETTAMGLGMQSAFGPGPGDRTQGIFGGGYALDHLYYRGLELRGAGHVGPETARGQSDHNSLRATFRLDRPGPERSHTSRRSD